MQIIDFTIAHVDEAATIAKENYEMQRKAVSTLPVIDKVPNLTWYAENGFGVAAFDGDTMLGFLCSIPPFDNAFGGSTDAIGVFSPMGANGAIGKNRAKTYACLYQAASEKWVSAGASSHAVCLYAHDKEALQQFFQYGFGIRCMDAISPMGEIIAPPCDDFTVSVLSPRDILKVLPLVNMLHDSCMDSPFFMYSKHVNEADFLKEYEHEKGICFIAEYDGQIIAFISAELDGETFICDTPGYFHIRGAYCLPKYRGKGVIQKLLSLLMQKLKLSGYTRLGVDFESFNPSGSAFWLKYFTAYTHSVVRRIDEYAITKKVRR